MNEYRHKTYYDLLEIDRDSSQSDIRDAFQFQSKIWHPDRFGGDRSAQDRVQQRQQSINEAYEVLRDPHKRSRYDRQLPPEDESVQVFSLPEQNIPSIWKRMAAWMKDEDVGIPFERKMAYTAGDILERSRKPTEKQMVQMLKAWNAAIAEGFDPLDEDVDE